MPIRSNCFVQAIKLFRERIIAWRKDPKRLHEPYLLVRPSRHPGGVMHVLVGELDVTTDQVRVESFKPLDPIDHPWWSPPVVFDGEWSEGDTKPTPIEGDSDAHSKD